MYTPEFSRVDDDTQIRAMVAAIGSAQLVTGGDGGFPTATLLPILWSGDTVIAHMARANPHWRNLSPATPALLICSGPEAYVSPAWYATKRTHGRVVPTWNYGAVHLSGSVHVRHDPAWLRDAVERLTDQHESRRHAPWHVTDAPPDYLRGQLNGIVGIEVTVLRVEAKAKLSQNRSVLDQQGVITGLQDEQPGTGAAAVAAAMIQSPATDR